MLVITGILFVVAGIRLDNFETALDMLLGRTTSFSGESWITVPLSIDGYLLLPTAIGVVVGAMVNGLMTARLEALTKVDDAIERLARGRPDGDGIS